MSRLSYVLGFLSLFSIAAMAAPAPDPAPVPDKDVAVSCRAYQDTNLKSVMDVPADRASEYALIRYTCRLTAESEVSHLEVSPHAAFAKACADKSGLCVAKSSVPAAMELRKNSASQNFYVVYRNADRRSPAKIDASTLGLTFETETPKINLTMKPVTGVSSGVNLGGDVKSSECQIYVSGAKDLYPEAVCSGEGCVPPAAVTVANGKLVFEAMIKGAGGDLSIPSAVTWEGGPDAKGIWETAPVDREVAVRAKVTTKDGVQNSCAVKFVQQGQGYALHVNKYGDCAYFAAVRDYYYLNPAGTAIQTAGYASPLTLPGFDVSYGKDAPDVPFRGILNAVSDLSGNIEVKAGKLIVPAAKDRRYSAPVVVARSMDPKTQKVGEPLYYGVINPDNYANTVMHAVGAEAADDTLLVFQFFLAGQELVGDTDRRGTPGGTAWHDFTEAKNGKPFDRLVPVANESCLPIFQVRAPARNDKEMPSVMKDAVSCAFSRPFKASELKLGRALVTVTHFVAERGSDLFPLDLLKGTDPTSTRMASQSVSTSTAETACWKIYPNLGAPNWSTGGPSDIAARSKEDECSMAKVTSSTVGYRYSAQAVWWGMDFGKRVKTSGVGEVLKWNDYFWKTYGVYSTGYANSSVLSQAPENEIYTQTFAARYWGHQVDDILEDETWDKAYGAVNPGVGNTIAAYRAPICPGSQFSYDNISLSGSPLVLDMAGHGIKISRNFHRSVGFDFKATGYKNYVDWPENTKEAAFLVLPDAAGQVTSMKNLFGDLKHNNGFQNLASYDANKDGRIDAADPVYAKLRLWFDENRDGVSQKGEVRELAKNGVVFINLAYAQPGRTPAAEEKTLSGLYYNSIAKKMMNVEDHYFYEYVDSKRVKRETAKKKK